MSSPSGPDICGEASGGLSRLVGSSSDELSCIDSRLHGCSGGPPPGGSHIEEGAMISLELSRSIHIAL